MPKIKYFLVVAFLMPGLLLLGGKDAGAGADDPPVMYRSERVGIDRPSPPPEVTEEEEIPDVSPDVSPEPADDEEEPGAVADDMDPFEMADEEDMLAEELPDLSPEERYYSEEGRIDPFEPFIRRTEPEPEDGVDAAAAEAMRRIPRTPLERIALGQLQLTAIIRGPDRNLAMVRDSRGRGYILEEGTYIGEEGGRVSGIRRDKVIVEEPHRDAFGKTTIREKELQLQKQAGE